MCCLLYFRLNFLYVPVTFTSTMFHSKEITVIKDQLIKRGQTIAVAESVTAGLLQSALASAEEASRFFQGGLTAYNIGQKCRHLNIDPIQALTCNCVSDQMAKDMALNVCNGFTSDWGIGITGYATPVPESGNQRFAYFAIAFKGEIRLSQKMETEEEDGQKVQLLYANTIMDKLAALVEKMNA